MPGIEDLGSVIDESTILDATVDEEARTLRLTLAVLAAPAPGETERPTIVIEFTEVTRIASRVHAVESSADPTPEQPWRMRLRDVGKPIGVDDIATMNRWLQKFRGDLYGQPYPMFDRSDPDWLAAASIDRIWATPSRHTIDLSFNTTTEAPGHVMDLRVWFDDVAVFDHEGRRVEMAAVVEAVRAWWGEFKAGRTRGQHGIVPAGE